MLVEKQTERGGLELVVRCCDSDYGPELVEVVEASIGLDDGVLQLTPEEGIEEYGGWWALADHCKDRSDFHDEQD